MDPFCLNHGGSYLQAAVAVVVVLIDVEEQWYA
jgi:hypothetical protein